MGAPQIIYICLASVGLLMTAYRHGKPRTEKYNVFVSLVASAIITALLIWGGFFN